MVAGHIPEGNKVHQSNLMTCLCSRYSVGHYSMGHAVSKAHRWAEVQTCDSDLTEEHYLGMGPFCLVGGPWRVTHSDLVGRDH